MSEEAALHGGDLAVEAVVLDVETEEVRDELMDRGIGEVVPDGRVVAVSLDQKVVGRVLELPGATLHPVRSVVEYPVTEHCDLGGERRACGREVVGCSQVFGGYHLIHLQAHRIIHI